MPTCTEAERAFLDEVRKPDGDFKTIEDCRYAVARESAGPDFFEAIVRTFVELQRRNVWAEKRDELFAKAESLGFTPGGNGGVARLWADAENEAAHRLAEDT